MWWVKIEGVVVGSFDSFEKGKKWKVERDPVSRVEVHGRIQHLSTRRAAKNASHSIFFGQGCETVALLTKFGGIFVTTV